jgi:hypothetical protein
MSLSEFVSMALSPQSSFGCALARTDSNENHVGQAGSLRTDWQSVHPGGLWSRDQRERSKLLCFRERRRKVATIWKSFAIEKVGLLSNR